MTSPRNRTRGTESFRTWLAHLPEEDLRALLSNRPEALTPAPPDFGSLATRLTLPMCIVDALAACNAAQLATLEDIAARGGELEPVEVTDWEVTEQLLHRGLVFGDPQEVDHPRTVQIVTGVMGALPPGWTLLHQLDVSQDSIDALPADEHRVLDTLAAGDGVGQTHNAAPDADPTQPVPRLIAKGLLERTSSRTVRLPHALRRLLAGEPTAPIPLTPSERVGEPVPDSKADDAGTAAGLGVVRDMEHLIGVLGTRPVALLKDGTLGVRALKQLVKELALESDEVARLISLGHQARLLGLGEPEGLEGHFLAVTEGAAEWLEAGLADKWRVLVDAWCESPWATWAGPRVFSEDTLNHRLPRFRRFVLGVYAHSAAPLGPQEFWEDLRFGSPLFASNSRAETIEHLRDEAEWIGAVALGRATRILFDSSAAAELVPETVSEFIIQADLTVLVPGPLEPAAHRTLASLADLESPGLASVFRISESTLRRGMDRGMTAQEITEFLSQHCPTGLPQALEFAIRDVSKRHGTLRSGPALSYLRSDDPALLELAVVSVPELRQLAPTVAVSSLRVGELLDKLRDKGLSPTAEDESGASIAMAPEPYTLPLARTTARKRPASSVDAAVAALRSARSPQQRPAAAGKDSVLDSAGTADTATSADIARAAARAQRPVTVRYADKSGVLQTLTVTPLRVEGGVIDALTADGKAVRFPLHRLRSVELHNPDE